MAEEFNIDFTKLSNEPKKIGSTAIISDPAPFDVDANFNAWNSTQPTEKMADNRNAFAKVGGWFARPFLSQGYNAAAALNRGLAGFSAHLDSVSDFIESSTGMKSGGLFEKAAEVYNDNADYWKERADKVGVNFFDELISEAAGGFAPGVAQFSLDVSSGLTFPFMAGYEENRENNPFMGGVMEAAKTGTLHGLFKMIGPLKQYLKAPTMGTVFGIEESANAPEGGKVRAFGKGFGAGVGYSLASPGGRLGLNEIKKNLMPELEKVKLNAERVKQQTDINLMDIDAELGPKKQTEKVADIESLGGPERYSKAAVKGSDGTIFEVDYSKGGHTEVANRMTEAQRKGAVDGAITSEGRFVERPKHPDGGDMDVSDFIGREVGPTPKAKEPTEGKKNQRKFLETVAESPTTAPEVSEGVKKIDPQDYVVQPNAESLGKARDRIDADGIDKTVDYLKSTSDLNAEKGATFIEMMDRAQKAGDFDRAIELVETYDTQLREAGRFVQAASIWNRLTPTGFIRWAEKQLASTRSKYSWWDTLFGRKPESFTLTPEEKKTIFERMTEINKMPEGVDKTDAMLQVINMVAQKTPPSVSELFDAYRYQNMLSSPKTHERNIGENALNAFLTRPLEITTRGGIDYVKAGLFGTERQAYLKDAPVYMKTALNSVPNATKAFMAVMKSEKGSQMSKPDLGVEVKSEFERARFKQIPKSLTVVTRFMEASDAFFSSIIGAGEVAIQKQRGATGAEAYKRAEEISQKYLYRDKLDPNDPDISYFSKVLSSVGKMMQDSRKLPGLGTLSKWYVPFIRTPINKGIAMIERSPLGLARGNFDQEAMSKIIAGSIFTGLGAMFAMDGNTTWVPPTDPKEKELFYAAGRKPFSVKIGDKWVPAWYLGPYALAFILPAAVKYYAEDRKQAITEDGIEKLMNIASGTAQFVGSQTSTQSIGALFQALSGDVDFTFPATTAFTLEQVIPAQGLVRFVGTIIDPVYRKPTGFLENIEKDLPFLSQSLEARKTPFLEDAQREPVNYFLPYDVGTSDQLFEGLLPMTRFESRQKHIDGKMNKLIKKMQDGKVSPEESIDELGKIFNANMKNLEMYGKELK